MKRLTKQQKHELAVGLQIAWDRYTATFGVPPHGTYKQLQALLELVPEIKSMGSTKSK